MPGASRRGSPARGHDVVLFASGDSDSRFRIDPVIPEHHERPLPRGGASGGRAPHRPRGRRLPGRLRPDRGWRLRRGAQQRLEPPAPGAPAHVHDAHRHLPARAPLRCLRWFVHDSPSPRHRITVTSRTHGAAWWPEGTAPGGIRASQRRRSRRLALPGARQRRGRLVRAPRPIKGAHRAIAAARRAGIPLTLFGPIEDAVYWETRIAPDLGGPIRYGGHLSRPALAREVGRASVFLFTPCWDEPFGLVAIEAMACGVPVAAIDRGPPGRSSARREALALRRRARPGGSDRHRARHPTLRRAGARAAPLHARPVARPVRSALRAGTLRRLPPSVPGDGPTPQPETTP